MMLLLHAALASPLLVSAETTLPAGDLAVQVAEVDCPAGYVALSGAAAIYGQITGVALLTSSPADSWETPTSWRVILARDPAAAGTSWGVQGSVRCLRASADAQVQRALVVASLPAGGGGEVTALCPAGTSVLAGGVEVTGVVDGRGIAASAPVATQGWRAEVVELDPAAPSTDRVDVAVGAWCLPTALWRSHVRVRSAAATGTATPSATASCPPGSWAVSGGARVDVAPAGALIGRALPGLALTSIAPNDPTGPADAWSVTAQELAPPGAPWGVEAVAFCFTP